jgi:hypothetical protein
MPPHRSDRPRFLPLLIAGVTLTSVAAYGPLLTSWLFPQLLGPEAHALFSLEKQDFDVVMNGPRLRWLGHERSETTPARGIMAVNPLATRGWERSLAREVAAIDRAMLGPPEADPFARPGLIVHRCRLGLPFPCVEATIASVWRDQSAELRGLSGGVRFAPLPGRAPARGVWLLPYGVLPLGLLGNVVFWSGLVGAPSLTRWAVRARRRRLGRCVVCGYDRSGLADPCPECGAVQ